MCCLLEAFFPQKTGFQEATLYTLAQCQKENSPVLPKEGIMRKVPYVAEQQIAAHRIMTIGVWAAGILTAVMVVLLGLVGAHHWQTQDRQHRITPILIREAVTADSLRQVFLDRGWNSRDITAELIAPPQATSRIHYAVDPWQIDVSMPDSTEVKCFVNESTHNSRPQQPVKCVIH